VTAEVCGCACGTLFLACCSFIFNKSIGDMNVKVTVYVLNMTMKIQNVASILVHNSKVFYFLSVLNSFLYRLQSIFLKCAVF
jgi:hypothetical protein